MDIKKLDKFWHSKLVRIQIWDNLQICQLLTPPPPSVLLPLNILLDMFLNIWQPWLRWWAKKWKCYPHNFSMAPAGDDHVHGKPVIAAIAAMAYDSDITHIRRIIWHRHRSDTVTVRGCREVARGCSKCETPIKWWLNVGPASVTLAQHWASVGSSCVVTPASGCGRW